MAPFLLVLHKSIEAMMGKTPKLIILSALMFLMVLPSASQDDRVKVHSTSGVNATCGGLLSAYRTFFNLKLYDDAYPTWLKVFNNCPADFERVYLDGVTMYRSFIEEAPDGPVREGLIDTLMLIYDRRIEYFGGEGNVIGRKGRDMLKFRGADIEQVQNAYALLRRSIELQGLESQDAVMVLLISAGIDLNEAEIIDDSQLIEDYMVLSEILDQLEGKSSRWKRARTTIDELMLNRDMLSCEALDNYFEPQFEQNKNDKIFLEKLISLYSFSVCERSELNAMALENLYRIDPGPESAHKLAEFFIISNDNEKAAAYLREAVQGENIDGETRARWYYELAVLSSANSDPCKAIEYAREAIRLKSDYGNAYILLGDAFIASRDNLGDDFNQRSAYWAAVDKYKKAASVDPSLLEESEQRQANYSGQYPNREDVFFRDIQVGSSYLVEGCINEFATVRSSK
jgi:tetratricopeptide (TPR) repeat protein